MPHDTEDGLELGAYRTTFGDLHIGAFFVAEEGDAYEKVAENVASLLIGDQCDAVFADNEPVTPVETAEVMVEDLRGAGWTQADFAAALREELS